MRLDSNASESNAPASDSDAPSTGLQTQVPYLTIVIYFITSRVLILLLAWLSLDVVEKGKSFPVKRQPIEWFDKWDTGWYLTIAQNGYYFNLDGKDSNTGFFPLYPCLIRMLSSLGIDLRISGYLLSNLALLATAFLLWKLVFMETANRNTAMFSVAFLLIGPVSFFFSIIYTEALFIFLTLGSLYFARRGDPFKAGLFGYGAALTRAYGFLLFIPLLWESLQPVAGDPRRQWRPTLRTLFSVLPILGLLTYMLYLYYQFGEPLAFQKTQAIGWNRSLAPFWIGLQNTFNRTAPFYFTWFLSAWIVGLVLLEFGAFLKVKAIYMIWASIGFAFVVSSTTLEALPRYLAAIFPYYMILGGIASRWPGAAPPLLWGSSMLLALSVILFVNGYWFT